MIVRFANSETEKLWREGKSRRFPSTIWRAAVRKLERLNAAIRLDSLAVPPGNHLEALRGNRASQHSIRIHQKYRACFRWEDGNAYDVEVGDYH